MISGSGLFCFNSKNNYAVCCGLWDHIGITLGYFLNNCNICLRMFVEYVSFVTLLYDYANSFLLNYLELANYMSK